ncbi:MAG TPA: molybdopterin biosynthesis protein MoeY [Caldimonas sp.]|nr:molybdopterin biosynthesis protein MoeY [Caldimonas sp.]
MTPRLRRILDLARWAPSGDNSQPWRFEIRSRSHVVVHARMEGLGVYDLEGSAALLSVGAMLETMRIAASVEGCALTHELRPAGADAGPLVDVRIEASEAVRADPLHAFVRGRSVQRRSLDLRSLEENSRRALDAAVGDGYRVVWFQSPRERLRLAWLAVRSARIRLTIPEAWEVHRRIIEWDARYSDDRIPDQALGTDALSVRSMRWILASWPRVTRMNRWFGGTLLPRLQLELIPGLRCAAHFVIVADKPPRDAADHLAAGAAAQRFWLTATRLGLQLQPQHTPLMFAAYARRGVRFSDVAAARQRAELIADRLDGLLGERDAENAVFMGRLGHGAAAQARSLRLALDRLVIPEGSAGPPGE